MTKTVLLLVCFNALIFGANCSKCVSPDGLVLAVTGDLAGGALSATKLPNVCSTFDHVYPSASTSCVTQSNYEQCECDTCESRGSSTREGWTLDEPLSGFNAELSLSVWIKPLKSDFTYGEIFGANGASNSFHLGWNPTDGVLGCGSFKNTSVPVGQWSHVVLIYRGAKGCTMWVNGEQHESVETLSVGDIQPAIACRGLGIGSSENLCSGDYSFIADGRGTISQISLWNRELSNAEVSVLQAPRAQTALSSIVCKTASAAEEPTTQSTGDSVMSGLIKRLEQLEATVAELSALKVRKENDKCIVQCDNGKNGGELIMD